MAAYIKQTLHPEVYHGHGAAAPFFEGWYYKLISADERHKLAIIPGIIKGAHGHAFVQILDGVSGQTGYHRLPEAAFQAAPLALDIHLDGHHFLHSGLRLAGSPPGDDPETSLALPSGQVQFHGLHPWPVTPLSPGIMGPFAWVPAMECYHGVLSLDHRLSGALTWPDGRVMDFDGGRGYIEKDWGRAFPAAWVWFQSNHFGRPGVCLTGSVARIPWLGAAFTGFIVGLLLDGKLYRFATYTGAQIAHLQVREQQVEWLIRDAHFHLAITACRARTGVLLGPTPHEMGKRVLETLDAQLHVRLSDRRRGLIFEGEGRHAGMEVFGEL